MESRKPLLELPEGSFDNIPGLNVRLVETLLGAVGIVGKWGDAPLSQRVRRVSKNDCALKRPQSVFFKRPPKETLPKNFGVVR